MPALFGTRRAALFSPEKKILDQLSAAPVYAISTERALRTGKGWMLGTPAAVTTVLDQAGFAHGTVTPASIALSRIGEIRNALVLNGSSQYLALAVSFSLGTAGWLLQFACGSVSTTSAQALLGLEGVAGPYVRLSQTTLTLRNALGGVATLTGGWKRFGFDSVQILSADGLNVSAYVNGELWASGAFDTTGAGGFGTFNRVGRNQTGNYFNGAVAEVIAFNGCPSASDQAALMADGIATWPHEFYFVGEGVGGSNSAAGWSEATAWANGDLISAASSTIPMKRVRCRIKYGAKFTTPFLIQSANQDATQAFPNTWSMFGDPALGPMVIDCGNHLTGATWTNVSGNVWSTPMAGFTSYTRAWWAKSGMDPQAALVGCDAAFDATPYGTAVNIQAVLDPHVVALTVAPSLVGMTSFSSFLDDALDLFYVNLGGTDPNGQDIVVGNQSTRVTNRGFQFSRPYHFAKLFATVMFAAEDGTVHSGTGCKIDGESWARPFLAWFNSADGNGGKGGQGYSSSYAAFVGNGDGRSVSGSEGDGASAHGNSSGTFYFCRFYANDKAGMDDEWSANMKYYNCRASDNNQNYMWLNQTSGSGAGAAEYHNCEGKAGTRDLYPMFQMLASVPATALIDGGSFGGAASLGGNNIGISLIAVSQMQVTVINNPQFIGFTQVVDNDSTAGGTVTGI